MRQTDRILSRFPGPVMLFVSPRRNLLGLALCGGVAAYFACLLFTEYPKTRGYISGWYGTIMAWAAMVGSGALAIRVVILLLFPGAASLTLDVDGFEIGRVFDRIRLPWRGVNEFRVETAYWPGRIGGPIKQSMYEDLTAGAERRDGAKVTRMLPEIYGRPSLHGGEFAGLMNEWRRRALAQPARPPGSPGGQPTG